MEEDDPITKDYVDGIRNNVTEMTDALANSVLQGTIELYDDERLMNLAIEAVTQISACEGGDVVDHMYGESLCLVLGIAGQLGARLKAGLATGTTPSTMQ